MIKEIKVKSALNRITSKYLPYDYDLNVYRGCSHNCAYCFALYTHTYMNDSDYFNNVYAKVNIAELLDKELNSKRKKDFVINLGGVCDNYQKAEEELSLMRDIWKVLIKHKACVTISTKSDLILRDIDLIDELSRLNNVNIASTITTMDESIASNTERGAVSSLRRFNMLSEFKKNTNCSIGVHNMPILPYLTDNVENIEALCAKAKEIGADYILQGSLNLKGITKNEYLNTLQIKYPNVYYKTKNLFSSSAYLPKEYSDALFKMVYSIQKKYGLSSNYKKKFSPQLTADSQLSLF